MRAQTELMVTTETVPQLGPEKGYFAETVKLEWREIICMMFREEAR
jgi:hypothetical protein